MLFKHPSYKGIVRQLRDSIGHYGAQDVRRFAIIQIGERELQDVACPVHLAQYLVEGEEVELMLSGVSAMSVIFAVLGIVAMLTSGDTPELEPFEVGGVIVFIVSCFYFFASFVNAGHVVISVTANGQKYTR